MNLKNRKKLARWKRGYKRILFEINRFFYKDKWTTNITLTKNYFTIVFAGLFINIFSSKTPIPIEYSPILQLVILYVIINCIYSALYIWHNSRHGYSLAYIFVFIGLMVGGFLGWAFIVGTILFLIGLISNCLVRIFYGK